MKKLKNLAGCEIPKGSGAQAKEVAAKIFREFGESRMKEFCKMHFKTAYEAMGKQRLLRRHGIRSGKNNFILFEMPNPRWTHDRKLAKKAGYRGSG